MTTGTAKAHKGNDIPSEPPEGLSARSTAPARVGRYQVLARLATGGMAEILLAKLSGPSGFTRPVVLKRVLPHLAREKQFRSMFLDEARVTARLRHRNVVQVHELGQANNELFTVMEYVEGENLSSLARRISKRRTSLPHWVSAHIAASAAAGLHAAHEMTDENGESLDLVHRDVSPHNIMVTYDGDVKVLDFGVAKAADSTTKTEAGVVKGKFAYMSPEQARGESIDRRADIFALGIILYELSTGTHLFRRTNQALTITAILNEEVRPPGELVEGYPPELEAICMKALSRTLDNRYTSADQMRRDLMTAVAKLAPGESATERLAALMKDLFADRIEKKKEMLTRIGSGAATVPVTWAETGSDIAAPPEEGGATTTTATAQQPVSASHAIRQLDSAIRQGKRKRRKLWLAAGLAVLAGGGVWTARPYFSESNVDPAGETSESNHPSPKPEVAALAGQAETLAQEQAPENPTPPAPPPRRVVELLIRSSPSGATVFLDGKFMGETPFRAELPKRERTRLLKLRLRGYQEVVNEVAGDNDSSLDFELTRVRRWSPKRSSSEETEDSPPKPPDPPSDFYRF